MTNTLPDPTDFDLGDRQVWDREPTESSRAYAAFRIYRDLSPMQRRLDAVADQSGLSLTRIQRLSSDFNWRDRTTAWDDACHRIEDKERLDAIRSMHAIHRKTGRAALMKGLGAMSKLDDEHMPASVAVRLIELGAKLERQTLIVSVEELQGVELESGDDVEDPWERIARELDPATATGSDD
jgi:hypothetical protein